MNARDVSRKPGLERLEGRELPTFTLIHHASLSPATLAALEAANVAKQVQANMPAPAAPPSGTPTPHELTRQTFVGKFLGTYTVGNGRTSGEAQQILTLGSGTTNQSLHGQYQMRVSIPTDPTVPTSGVIALFPTNVATSGSTLILDLTADPTSLVRGLPTRYTWTVDPSSSGIYTNAGGYGMGQGTLEIHFLNPRRGPAPATQSGKTTVVIHGLINVGGVFNDLGVPGNRSANP